MTLLVLSTALAVGVTVGLLATLLTGRPSAVGRRLSEVRQLTPDEFTVTAKIRRESRRKTVEDVLQAVGSRVAEHSGSAKVINDLLVHAGYRQPAAPAIFWGVRLALMLGLGIVAFMVAPLLSAARLAAVMAALYCGAMGYVLPTILLRSKARARQKEITLALPDAIDLLIVCVESGLGINQALMRVAQEIHHISKFLAQELHLTNLEIRAGRARNEALRNLTERTGVEDIRGLVGTLIQAERFGTPIGPALRIHAETLRDKRKQRAREAAAKTTIKLVFPLVFCIFPALFVVLIGPGLIQIVESLSSI